MTVTFRPDTSFPYLAFAMKRRIRYGEVLLAAEEIERRGEEMMDCPPASTALTKVEMWDLLDLVYDEQSRRRAAVTS